MVWIRHGEVTGRVVECEVTVFTYPDKTNIDLWPGLDDRFEARALGSGVAGAANECETLGLVVSGQLIDKALFEVPPIATINEALFK